MKSLLLSIATVALVATSTSNAAVLVYGGGTQTGSRFNSGAGVITYMNCFTAIDGTGLQTQLVLDSAIVGIRRVAAFGALTDVGINISAAEMTYDGANYGLGASYPMYSSASLGAGAATVTQLVDTGSVSGVTLTLETVSNAGFGGFWIGVEFTGANAANVANGWRVVNTPTEHVYQQLRHVQLAIQRCVPSAIQPRRCADTQPLHGGRERNPER